ncbi:peptidoglycan-binding protein [Alkalihalobacillus alcalophilus ATCC 27647 = CGMCC 1.3604]|uniref:Peptidoglycan-binding protein n=1 Tax=Alkalihalobacillus alcalophilus ATCC 27647 = CGMCC 1.3604 TaxID=1218173 RepID=A0A094WDG3_ALKAL|nr:cell wall hydrolase [Alkalihalobacillus alcalophilus]KGA95779.1 peptidoglycan-binding protein [Alkalihalobacillus alcalophilus ATCC 27647 = CGMCC 1.3604]MED1564181.1 cell wall hydrolase [Alkalihalobacillus alcalophilus]THG89488.1 peptidoglycan-binding protein [Alkalihalobacillus alcalophilus ATCC 27647 = CGMCC 1.3604]
MKKLIITICVAASLVFIGGNDTNAQITTHTVASGEFLYKIGQKYGVSVSAIKNANNKSSSMIMVGERLTIPESISASERDLLARLVMAESEGEPYAGKVAVATVVLNRVDHKDFPNTVRGVINEVSNGYYAFTPVQNGRINRPADNESIRAVDEALAFRGQGSGSLFFYNPKIATNQWIATRTETVRIGNHVFAK